jgi:hypothetical protein
VSKHTSVNMLCATCGELWPCLPKKEEVIDMLIGAAGLSHTYVDLNTIPEEVHQAWKAYTNAIARNYKITNINSEWRLELINE